MFANLRRKSMVLNKDNYLKKQEYIRGATDNILYIKFENKI